MSNPEQVFNDLGIDAITAVNLMDAFGLGIDEIGFPQRFHKMQEVVKYLKQFPPDTQRFLIKKACYGKPVDKLDHMFEYTRLLSDKTNLEDTLARIEIVKASGPMDVEKAISADMVRKETEGRLSKLMEEIQIYER